MNYETPEDMRAALASVADPALVEATIALHFARIAESKKRPKTRKAKKRLTYAETMEIASRRLLEAIDRERIGRAQIHSQSLVWNTQTGADAVSTSVLRDESSHYRSQEQMRVSEHRAEKVRVDALRVHSATPCFHCGAARECEHRA